MIIYVYFDHDDESLKLGSLFVSQEKGFPVYSFQYSDEFLASKYAFLFIDGNLSPYQESQYLPIDKSIFPFITDSIPDRWGRKLLLKEEATKANKENRKARRLTDIDYLLGVSDFSRMGCLRYKLVEDGDYLSSSRDGIPPFEKIRDIEYASLQYENNELGKDDVFLKALLSPGSSLGGARPKATFVDTNGEMWIAKFPSKHDEYDIGKWEMVAFSLAELCGIQVSEHKLVTYSKYGSTFLTKRFDRKKDIRIAFMSALTALNKQDGDNAERGISYLDIASFIKSNGKDINSQLEQLFRRIAFNIAISNTDDHLRNHGFILDDTYWLLSPAFDLNPSPYGNESSLLIDQDTNAMDYKILLDTCNYYYLTKEKANAIIKEIKDIVNTNWKRLANQYQINNDNIKEMEKCFSNCDI